MSKTGKNTQNSLLAYRVMAFVTGIVLLSGTIGLILQWAGTLSESDIGWLWVAHGYLYLVYLVATVNLGFRLRWNPVRTVLVALAGTIPTMSFVAEHFVTRDAKVQLAGEPVPA